MLAQGLSNIGDSRRMERFLQKLLNGDAVTMVALGGSITAGQGVTMARDNYVERLYRWVQATFPNDQHRLLNKGLPGTTSAYVSPCALQIVPPDADFVLLEFTFNDAERASPVQAADDPTRRGFERLIRKMLNLQKRPAVAYFHVWTPRRLGTHFYESPENVIEMVPEYYGLPSISMRNALYHMVANLTVPAEWLWRSDINHANCVGHRYMADLIIGYLQNVALHVIDHMRVTELLHEEAVHEALHMPMFDDNWENHASRCQMDFEFKSLVSEDKGWQWVNEGKSPDRPKWGLVSETEGDSLAVQVPMDGFGTREGEEADDSPLTLAVSCLMSYERTGAVKLECEEGCTCKPREYSLRHWNHVSLVYWKPLLNVKLWDGTNACVVRVTNPERNSTERKLKVTGVLATRETFMVSIYDYNKDAEEAERAEEEAAAPTEMSPAASSASAAIKRNLSGGVTVTSRPCQSAASQIQRAAMQWALPAWGLVAALLLALVWDRRRHLHALPQLGDISLARSWRGSLGGSKMPVLRQ
ncbi:g4156 [Coccomyxa viridis]|uniref:G4156 protein n=1 Tax=Coccomyxa viridis TaxID=1274662 RepID=A0ABP1FR74_9CHLO